MLRWLRWVALGVVVAVGAYALAGTLLCSRYDGKVAAFRASEACADLQRRSEDVPAGDNAVSLFAAAAALLEQLQEEHATYAYVWAWEPDEREKICTPPASEDGEDVLDLYGWQREEMRSALPSLDPFVAALAAALERPAVQFPLDPSEAEDETLRFATDMLPFRARLLPDRAAESGDLLLRLGTKWRARETSDPIRRHEVVREALRIVRDVLARDPAQAMPCFGPWRGMLAAEDPLALFRFECATLLRSTADTVEQVRRGEDPYKDVRGLMKAFRLAPPSRSFFRWYARPVFYWSVIAEMDPYASAIEAARTDAGLRELLRRPGLLWFLRTGGIRTLEGIALRRLAETALAAAAGDPLPELENPFTGRPLDVRQGDGVTVIEATLAEEFRDRWMAPELLTWQVRR